MKGKMFIRHYLTIIKTSRNNLILIFLNIALIVFPPLLFTVIGEISREMIEFSSLLPFLTMYNFLVPLLFWLEESMFAHAYVTTSHNKFLLNIRINSLPIIILSYYYGTLAIIAFLHSHLNIIPSVILSHTASLLNITLSSIYLQTATTKEKLLKKNISLMKHGTVSYLLTISILILLLNLLHVIS